MPPVGPSVNPATPLVGPMLIGSWLNVWLLGALLMQIQTYLRNSGDDPKWIKGMVAFLLVCGVTNSFFDTFFTYDYAIRQFGNFVNIQTSTWVVNTEPVMTVIMSYTVQTFYGWRVKRLTGRNILAGFIFVFAFAQLICGLAIGIECGIVKEFVHFQRFKSIVIVWLVLGPITDCMIAGSLCWYLHTHRTGFHHTNDLIDKASRLTLQTGAITAVWAAVDLALYLAIDTNLHLVLNDPLGLLYCNCLMSSLNARHHWRASSRPQDEVSSRKVGKPSGITVTTRSEVHREQYELEVTAHCQKNDGVPAICSRTPSMLKQAEHMDDGTSLGLGSMMEGELTQKSSEIDGPENN